MVAEFVCEWHKNIFYSQQVCNKCFKLISYPSDMCNEFYRILLFLRIIQCFFIIKMIVRKPFELVKIFADISVFYSFQSVYEIIIVIVFIVVFLFPIIIYKQFIIISKQVLQNTSAEMLFVIRRKLLCNIKNTLISIFNLLCSLTDRIRLILRTDVQLRFCTFTNVVNIFQILYIR